MGCRRPQETGSWSTFSSFPDTTNSDRTCSPSSAAEVARFCSNLALFTLQVAEYRAAAVFEKDPPRSPSPRVRLTVSPTNEGSRSPASTTAHARASLPRAACPWWALQNDEPSEIARPARENPSPTGRAARRYGDAGTQAVPSGNRSAKLLLVLQSHEPDLPVKTANSEAHGGVGQLVNGVHAFEMSSAQLVELLLRDH